MNNLLNQIKEKGYWKVIIRPTKFIENRFEIDQLGDIIENNKVVLRGWDYPHIDHRDGTPFASSDSVESNCNWPEGPHFEYWRFYQNGQFVHFFSMKEDYVISEEKKNEIRNSFTFSKADESINRFLSILNALYSITEIYKFASNIAKLLNNGEKIEIIIELGKTENRVLFNWDSFSRSLYNSYKCIFEPVIVSRIISKEEIITNYTNHALEVTASIFKMFNWKEVNMDVLSKDQVKFLKRQI